MTKTEELFDACSKQDIEKIRELVKDKELDINSLNKYGLTPLMVICSNIYDEKSFEIIKLLCENGANPNASRKDLGHSVLMFAYDCYSFINNPQVNATILNSIRYLLEHDANPNHQDKFGNTVLMYACNNDDVDVVQLLVDHDREVFSESAIEKNSNGLKWGLENGFESVVNESIKNRLLHAQLKIDLKNNEGQDALFIAEREESHECAKILKKRIKEQTEFLCGKGK